MKHSFRSRLSLFTLRLRLTARMARALALLLIFATTFAVMLPAQQADSLKLGAQAVPGDTGRWQLTWQSVVGQAYRLERSPDLTAGTWTEVTTLTATATVTSFTDPQRLTGNRNFWRVVVIGAGTDSVPPTVSIIDARLIDQSGVVALELKVRATDNIAVIGVNYAEGVTQLGAATAGPTQTWTRIVPLVPGAINPRQFQAVARDQAGNTGFSDIYTFRPQQAYPAGMRPLGGAGVSASGVIGEKPDGTLQPFTYMPDSNAGRSPQRALRVDFPQGATLLNVAGQSRFQSGQMVLGFGPQAPLRFDPAAMAETAGLASSGSVFDGFGLVVPIANDQTAQLAASGGLSYETARQLLGLPAGARIPMRLFNRFLVLWKGGTFKNEGLIGGKFAMPNLNLPLPAETGEYAGSIVDLLSGKPADFPIHGNWALPGTGVTLKVTRARPLVLTLKPDGSLALNGPVTVQFSNGVRLQGTITLDDPTYKFCLESDTISVPLMTILESILPNNAANCIPAGFDDATLDHAEDCLRSYDRAYKTFLQAALNLRPDEANDAALGATPGPQDLLAAAAECFGATAATDVAASLPLQAIRDFTNSWWKPSIPTDDLLTALQNLDGIKRLTDASLALAASGPASADETAMASESTATMAQACAEVIRLSQTPQASASIEHLHAIAEMFVLLILPGKRGREMNQLNLEIG